jgi:shikimate dehydrogenase
MKIKAAVIGDPISHSLSPKMHNFWLQQNNINGSYEAKLVKKENLEDAIKSMVDEGYAGFNVTIPHKEKMFELCNSKTEKANLTKAVNTVTISNGKLHGDNSDCEGFLENLKFFEPNFSLKNKNAFLIGSGGAARAIVFALINSGAKKVFITNRNQQKTQILINDFQVFAKKNNVELQFLAQEEFVQNLNQCDLLINSTSLGITGQPPLELNLKNLQKSAIVYDIVYKPLMTNLLKQAKTNGNKIVTGIGMLAFQGAVGFEYWFKQKPKVTNELLEFLIKESC